MGIHFVIGTPIITQRVELSSKFRLQERRFVRRFSQSSKKWRAKASSKRVMGCSSSMAKFICTEISNYGF